jgi:crossover junction endodeoxyribonuclease RuvC
VARVLGVDPGLVATGWAVVDSGAGRLDVRDHGVVETRADMALEARLEAIHAEIDRVLEHHAPEVLILEDLYSEYRFPRTALLMAHARGVICLAAGRRGVAVVALAPAEVKRAVAFNGGASKAQVQHGVQHLFGLDRLPRPSHVADALALAFTGASRLGGRPA